MELRHRAFSAIRWTAAATMLKSALQLIQVIVLARLLAPHDFGLMAVIMSVLTFLAIFADMGVSNALIHYQEVSEQERSSLYWLNILTGFGLMSILFIASPFIANFYDAGSIKHLLQLVSITLLLGALSRQLQVLAEKALLFATIVKIELLSSLLGFAMTIVWAWLSPSVYALVSGLLVSSISVVFFSWLWLADGWRPMWRFYWPELKKFVGYGGYLMGNNLVTSLHVQSDILLGGRFIAPAELGLYAVPRDFCLRMGSVINSVVTRVGLPLMAQAQNNREQLKRIYLHTIRMTTSVNFPVYTGLAVFAHEVILVVFGTKWLDAAPLLQVLALWGMLRSVGNPAGSLVFAVGRADLAFRWNLVLAVLIPLLIWLAVQYGGVKGLAVIQSIIMAGLIVPAWFVLIRPTCGARLDEFAPQILVPLLLSGLSGLAAWVSVWALKDTTSRLAVGILVGGVSYIGLSWIFNRVWIKAMHELLLVLVKLKSTGK